MILCQFRNDLVSVPDPIVFLCQFRNPSNEHVCSISTPLSASSPSTPRRSTTNNGSYGSYGSGLSNGSIPPSSTPPTSTVTSSSSALPSRPGLIDTSSLVQSPPAAYRGITVLTGEGGRLRNSGGRPLVRGKDYELVPERLWKFLAQMYGGSPPLPRQVIR